jgi:hypothetical protein
MDLAFDLPGVLLGAVMAVTAVLMACGWKVRLAAWLLIAAGPLGMIEFGVSPVVQRLDLLGPAVFFSGRVRAGGRPTGSWDRLRTRLASALRSLASNLWPCRREIVSRAGPAGTAAPA